MLCLYTSPLTKHLNFNEGRKQENTKLKKKKKHQHDHHQARGTQRGEGFHCQKSRSKKLKVQNTPQNGPYIASQV